MTAVLSGEADIGFMGSESSIYTYQEGANDVIKNFAQLTLIIPGLSEPPVRTLRAIYSGNSEPPYWALLHIFPLYCKDTPLV